MISASSSPPPPPSPLGQPRLLHYIIHSSSPSPQAPPPPSTPHHLHGVSNLLVDHPADIHSRWVAHLPPPPPSSSSSSSQPTATSTAEHTPATAPPPSAPPSLVLKLRSPAILCSIRFGKHCRPLGSNMRHFSVQGALDESHFLCDLLRMSPSPPPPTPAPPSSSSPSLTSLTPSSMDVSPMAKMAGPCQQGTLKNDEFAETVPLRSTLHTPQPPPVAGALQQHADDRSDGDGYKHIYIPCQYIRLLPLSAWDDQREVSVWSIQLFGWSEERLVKHAIRQYRAHMERESIRLCLKFLRQNGYDAAFQSLLQEHMARQSNRNAAVAALDDHGGEQHQRQRQQHGNILEHELLTQLHQALVERGDFEESERILANARHLLRDGTLRDGTSSESPSTLLHSALKGCEWKNLNIRGIGFQEATEWEPCKRGGHQMLIDEQEQMIYLFGGWDGRRELGDLWKYDIGKRKWELLQEYEGNAASGSERTSEDGVVPPSPEFSVGISSFPPGRTNDTMESQQRATVNIPTPRSCHKMCLCRKRKRLYIFGRYLDIEHQQQMIENNSLASDFFYWDIEKREWILLCKDALAENGPPLIFDHQMCIDEDAQMIYVFGGRISQAHVQHHRRQRQQREEEEEEQRQSENGNDDASETEATHNSRQFDANQTLCGLYVYDIQRATWKLLMSDNFQPSSSLPLKPRLGHSMVFDKKTRSLVIFGGMRNKEILNDMYLYSVDTNTLLQFNDLRCSPFQNQTSGRYPTPETHQMTFDPDTNCIHVFTTVENEKSRRSSSNERITGATSFAKSSIRNTLWLCQLPLDTIVEQRQKQQAQPNRQQYAVIANNFFPSHNSTPLQFERVLDLERSPYLTSVLTDGSNSHSSIPTASSVTMATEQAFSEPCPRYAYQFVLDPVNKIHYLFGGNPGDDCSPDVRLNDFWHLRLKFSMRDRNSRCAIGGDHEMCNDQAEQEDDGMSRNSHKLLQYCCYMLRRQRFIEMCVDMTLASSNVMQPLHYLRGHVSKAVDEDNMDQIEDFRHLVGYFMFPGDQTRQPGTSEQDQVDAVVKQRKELYNQLVEFFPAYCKQPSLDLMNIVQLFALG